MGNTASSQNNGQGQSTPHQLTAADAEKFRALLNIRSRLYADSYDALSATASSPPLPTGDSTDEQKKREILSCSLKGKGIDVVPLDICVLRTLASLDLSENEIRELPTELGALRSLRRLAIGTNKISVIPDFFGYFRELTWLDFTHNDVHTISPALGDLPNLASLGASDCRLVEFPAAICKMKALRKLGIFNNMIHSLPAEIGNLRALSKLDLSGNALTSLPKEIGNLTNLTWLNLSKNQLEYLPDELNNLVNLQELGLAFNRIKRLPDLSGLQQLVLLPVYSNDLEEIGDWLATLKSLAKLDLSFNKLKGIPEGLFAMPSLTYCNLRRNELTTLPEYNPNDLTARSPTLDSIDVRDNLLRWIPLTLMSPHIKEFRCIGNPLEINSGPLNFGPRQEPPPSLRQLALSTVINKRIPMTAKSAPILVQKDHYRVQIRDHRRCIGCNQKYCVRPSYNLLCIETMDSQVTPFRMEACSQKCMMSYRLEAGVHYPAEMETGRAVAGDPRSPRQRLARHRS